MKSLSDLNNFSTTGIEFTDNRPQVYEFTTVTNQTVSAYPTGTFRAPSGTELVQMISPNVAAKFSINLTSKSDATVSWGDLTGLGSGKLVANSSGSVYTVWGIRNVADWNLVHRPNIHLPSGTYGNWSYSSTITFENTQTQSWSTAVTMLSLDQLSDPSGRTYYQSGLNKISANPTVIDLTDTTLSSNTYTVTVTTNNASLTTTMSSTSDIGGTSSYDMNSGVLTLSGNVMQLNDRLNHTYYQFSAGTSGIYKFTYSLTNSKSNYTTVKTQLVEDQTNLITANANINRTFLTNTPDQLIFAEDTPSIIDTISTDTYTVVLQSEAGLFGFDANTLAGNLTLSGNVSYINSTFPTVKFYPHYNVSGLNYFSYKQSKAGIEQFTISPVLLGISGGGGTFDDGSEVVIFTESSVFIPNYLQTNYRWADIYVIGGGGSGSGNYGYHGGGGGGGGGVVTMLGNVMQPGAYYITIGDGGTGVHPTTTYTDESNVIHAVTTSGINGNATTFTGDGYNITAEGGRGGTTVIIQTASDGLSVSYVMSGGGGSGGAGYTGPYFRPGATAGVGPSFYNYTPNNPLLPPATPGVSPFMYGGTGGAGYPSMVIEGGQWYSNIAQGGKGMGYGTISNSPVYNTPVYESFYNGGTALGYGTGGRGGWSLDSNAYSEAGNKGAVIIIFRPYPPTV